MLTDVTAGFIDIRNAADVLGHSEALGVSPAQARQLAAELDLRGRRPAEAERLRAAADQAEYLANENG
ncbi:hypothetical protein [Mycobacteroides abscessus]|uniref:hypothetical protein n=1 Tax=Mycobacteroides abscessus TaxID=36809 RepID=UPI0005E66CB1|nr:hypothetical protein [Mycobacteroides abscessus]CPW71927.1 Uncharacterised protein [Mycobacteroides abscessus]SKF62147.1 Uncharacterised protein [Mycobacteroides abscessus subsp. bolletii]SKH91342.1 Uncharacterised protein [Mycobacteroides abscessus subsp. bolletii]